MILERLVLHNFGPYLGRQEIDLSIPNGKRPVVLFGGMNGGGKTTILSALQVVLFGRLSSVWRSTESSYDNYLRKCIHKKADPAEGAGIELRFRSAGQGTDQTLHICRYWRATGSTVRESLDVIRDEDLDPVLAENWQDWVEEFIPARVAPLFFFDGERIEELADPEKSSEILQAAIHSLLGLDIVDQLQGDLEILERRKRKEAPELADDNPLVARERDLQKEVQRCSELVLQRTQDLGALRNEVERLQKQIEQLEQRLASQGGALFERRHELEAEREKLQGKAQDLEQTLREVAAGGLPFGLVLPMLQDAVTASQQTQVAAMQTTVLQVLEQRDEALLQRLQSLRPSKALLTGLQAFLDDDRRSRQGTDTPTEVPLLDSSGLARAHALLAHVLPTELAQAQALLKKLDELETQIQNVDRKLAGLPDEEQILPMLRERDQLRSGMAEQVRAQEVAAEILRVASLDMDRARKSLETTQQEMADGMLEGEDVTRILRHSLRARGTLHAFRTRVLESHVRRIEKLALECFSSLMRKQFLVQDLRIDPQTFALELRDESGHRIPPDKLSAGERQLLAIGLLWGLSRASGRPLPTVIDTPLGRLDSSHRRNLVERYFPFASHQVILLSTDEEIDQRFQEQLAPFTARSYLLDFDDRKQQTQVKEGYFW